MRKSTLFLLLVAGQIVGLGALLWHTTAARQKASSLTAEGRTIVRALQLTDLCLFTEARYTRHPSQADLATPFQDHPLSLEHFPSGSLLAAPVQLRRNGASLD